MNREDIDILEVGNAYTALFYKKNHYQPYIVAWHFDPDSYTWDQGHYFCDLKSAKKFFAEQERNNANCKYCEKLDSLTGIASDDYPMKRVESLLVRIFGKGE